MVSGGLGPHRQLHNFSPWCAKQGYTQLFARLLDHPNITVALGTDYRDLLNRFSAAQVVYTEPADAYFDYRYGKLRYRSSEFRFEHHDTERFEAAPTIYHPTEHSYTRVSEFTQFTGQKHHKTCLVYEYPRSEGEPFYLVPTPQNAALYKKYQALADKIMNVHFISRLATFENCCMDDVVAQALTLSSRLSGVSAKSHLATAARA